jgi:hypothetical protein
MKSLTLKDKLVILFVDYIIVIGIILIVTDLTKLGESNPWLFRFSVYLIYYFISELLFNRTFGMRLFNVAIDGKKVGQFNLAFMKYSCIILIDRFVLLILYIFRMLFFSNKILMLSENYSGLRWKKKINTVANNTYK